MRKSTLYFLLLFLSAFNYRSYSAVEVQSSRVGGTGALAMNTQITVYNEKYTTANNWWNMYEYLSHDAVVIFGLDETKQAVYPVDFITTITYNVKAYDNSGVLTNFTGETLSFTYKKSGVYSDKELRKFGNYAKLIITVTAMGSQNLATSASIANPPALYLEGEIRSTCFYKFTNIPLTPPYSTTDFNYNIITKPCGGSSCPSELELYWPYCQGAEEYEVEWTWVDDYPGAPLVFDFSHDATRIVTNTNYYRIPLVYEKGYLTFRYRCIGRKGLAVTDRLESRWSSSQLYPDFGKISLLPTNFKYQITSGNSATADYMNWNATMTFSEDGKKGSGINYMDGLLMSRQNQAMLNTEGKVIAGQTLYDYQGRPAVTVLPAPLNAGYFQYDPAFSKNAAGQTYSKADFDKDIATCAGGASQISKVNSTGSANYYSPSNTNQAGAQGYVPDAGEYPFVQVEYTPDNTNRPVSQSLPGPAHKLGSGHESRYLYANPGQPELGRLFGSEAGNAMHYDKDITIDANNQISASYKDMSGRVIATALMGDAPGALDPIAGYNSSAALVDDMMNFDQADADNSTWTASKNIFVEAAGSIHNFQFQFTPLDFTDPTCSPKCFDCIYEVELSIKDECGAEIQKANYPANQPITQVVGSVITPANIGTCDSPSQMFSLASSPIPVTFPKIGTYQITKTLRLSSAPTEQYLTEYLLNNSCLKPKDQFINDYISNANIDFSTCGTDCPSCSTSVNTFISTHPGVLTTAKIAQLYADCAALPGCTSGSGSGSASDPCADMRSAMMDDFFPGTGQYATYTKDGNGHYSGCTDQTSIFYTGSKLIKYTAVSYPGVQVILPGTTAGVSPAALTPQQFIDHFDPAWEKFFVNYHPEYAYLVFCGLNTPSDLYDQLMLQTTSFDEACDLGLVKPLSSVSTNCMNGTPYNCKSNADPFFDTGGQGLVANDAVYSGGFTDQFNNITAPGGVRNYKTFMQYAFSLVYPIAGSSNPQNQTIYALAHGMATGGSYSTLFGCDPSAVVRDNEWLNFRSLYLNYKARLVAQRRTDFVMQKLSSVTPNISTQLNGFNGCLNNSGLPNFVPSNPTNVLISSTSGVFPSSGLSPVPTSLNFMPFVFNNSNNHQANLYYAFLAYPVSKLPFARIHTGCQNRDYNPYGGDVDNCSAPANLQGDALQPCSYVNAPFFVSKTARFMQAPFTQAALLNTYNAANPGTPILPPLSQLNTTPPPANVTNAYCNSTCSSYADELMNKIKGCNPAIDPASASYNSALYTNIKAQLIDVCVRGCDGNNPFGASSVAPANTQSGNTPGHFNSFNEILTYYAVNNALNANCDPNLIGMPKPYGANISNTANNPAVLNTCGCDKVLSAAYGFLNNPLPAGITTVQQYFEYLYTVPAPNFSTLRTKCEQAWGGGSNALTNWHTTTQVNLAGWTTTQANALLTSPVTGVGDFFDCPKPCLPCSTVVNAVNAYNSAHPTYASSSNYSTLLENSLNATLGFNLSYNDYKNFYDQCSGGTGCTQQQALATKVKNMVNEWIVLYNSSLPTGPYGNTQFYSSGSPALPSFFPSTGVPDFLSCSGQTSGFLNAPSLAAYANGRGVKLTETCGSCELLIENGLVLNPVGSNPLATTSLPVVTSVVFSGSGTTFILHLNNGSDVSAKLSCLPVLPPCNVSLCNKPLNETPVIADNCASSQINNAYNNAVNLYNSNLKNLSDDFRRHYKDKCSQITDAKFERSYSLREYHYTLYYYDQAGNLVRTVPPKGVNPLTTSPYNTVPAHSYITNYTYQSYDSPLTSKSPDETATVDYLYDKAGRIVASANAKQKIAGTCSYTFYDAMGRITEVGEVNLTLANITSNMASYSGLFTLTGLNTGYSSNQRKQVIKTFYDVSFNTVASAQLNLRNRVASVTYEDVNDNNDYTYNHGTHYSYDEHGNVKTLVQENRSLQLGTVSQDTYFFTMEYEYDLISGNVNKVSFQKDRPDAFFHKYEYDADNRLHLVLTSKDGVHYDRDAKYFYYAHGPLARKELGEQKVHAEDYAYTIQGWIKSMNGNVLDPASDPGKDGGTSGYSTTVANLHKYFGRDAFGYSLNYFTQGTVKDYSAITSANFNTTTNKNPVADISGISAGSPLFALQPDGPDLFNGNISSMVTAFIDMDPAHTASYKAAVPQITAYRYDQLHRLKQSKAYRNISPTNNAWNFVNTSDGSYQNTFTYDMNGNILTNVRNGVASINTVMDNLSYIYNSANNQLIGVNDAATASPYTTDIKGTSSAVSGSSSTYDYNYDDIGSLILDKKEHIASIEWTTDRKVKRVIRETSSTLPDLEYEYDANRQRVAKIIKPRVANSATYKPQNEWIATYYVRDAEGNVMATYDKKFTAASSGYNYDISSSEFDIYGSQRLGTDAKQVAARIAQGSFASGAYTPGTPPVADFSKVKHMLGNGAYELSNHLGNVVTTISDRKVPVFTTGASLIDYYAADVQENHDYYPGGMIMPGRDWTNGGNYRYGFNGKENDNEIKGNKNSIDFGARIYDPRIIRWSSIDPDYKLYPNNNPYHFGYNNPIYYKDLDGGVISGATKEDFNIVYQSVIKIFSNAKLKREIFQVAENGTQFKHIDSKDFAAAIEGLDENAKALAKGYYEAINSNYEYQIKIVNNNTTFDDDFRSNVIQSETAKESFDLNSGKEIANEIFNGGVAFENGVNKSLLILNQEYITNDSKISRNDSREMLKRDFNSAVTNAIFGEFFAKDNFISDKRSKESGYNRDYFITKIQMENLSMRVQGGLFQTDGYPIFSVFNYSGLRNIPIELNTESPSKPKGRKGPGTHSNDRDLEGGISN